VVLARVKKGAGGVKKGFPGEDERRVPSFLSFFLSSIYIIYLIIIIKPSFNEEGREEGKKGRRV
jgi:hypothetical protein